MVQRVTGRPTNTPPSQQVPVERSFSTTNFQSLRPPPPAPAPQTPVAQTATPKTGG